MPTSPVILIIAALGVANRKRFKQPVKLPLFLVALVIFQGILGMWTVTMGLQPTIVMLHLLGGFTTFTLLALLAARLYRWPSFLNDCDVRSMKPLASITLAALVLQIALGGWVSTNYAVLACTQFPTCQDSWWPPMNFAQGFEIWRHLGVTGEGVPLDFAALTAIHYAHRLLALNEEAGAAMRGVDLGARGQAQQASVDSAICIAEWKCRESQVALRHL